MSLLSQRTMETSGSVSWLSLFGLLLLLPDTYPYDPLHFSMGSEYERVARSEAVLEYPGKDPMLMHTMQLLYDEADRPLLFFSDILTPVCIDNICKPMAVKVYWNLVGAYVGFGIHPEEPLTKYDHDLFEEADYAKLHDLLRNPHSILERRKLTDLFDPNAQTTEAEPVTYDGREVDAVSGATKKEIRQSVVEGALYSCYTLWHLVHGEAVSQMDGYLDSIYSDELAGRFLYSDYADYQMYALKRFDDPAMERHLPRILTIVRDAQPLTRRYILKKLPDELWPRPVVTDSLYARFEHLDNNSKTILLDHLDRAQPRAAGLLAPSVKGMSVNQLRGYLGFLEQHPDLAGQPSLRRQLERHAADETFAYGYLITAFLEGD